MLPKDLIVLFCNASEHSLLCQLFTPIVPNAYVNLNIENATES